MDVDDVACCVEADVAVAAGRRDDRNRCSVGVRCELRIRAEHVGCVVSRQQEVTTRWNLARSTWICEQLVAATGHHDVETAELAGECDVGVDVLEVRDHDDLVHPAPLETVDLVLNGRRNVRIDDDTSRAGDERQVRRGRTDDADLLPSLLDDDALCDHLRLEQGLEARFAGEVQVGTHVGRVPGLAVPLADELGEYVRPEVEVVVAESDCVVAEPVECHGVVVDAGIDTGLECRAGEEVVTRRNEDDAPLGQRVVVREPGPARLLLGLAKQRCEVRDALLVSATVDLAGYDFRLAVVVVEHGEHEVDAVVLVMRIGVCPCETRRHRARHEHDGEHQGKSPPTAATVAVVRHLSPFWMKPL